MPFNHALAAVFKNKLVLLIILICIYYVSRKDMDIGVICGIVFGYLHTSYVSSTGIFHKIGSQTQSIQQHQSLLL
jgi:hypothetical protein